MRSAPGAVALLGLARLLANPQLSEDLARMAARPATVVTAMRWGVRTGGYRGHPDHGPLDARPASPVSAGRCVRGPDQPELTQVEPYPG
ncbi:hypothetical protein SAMN05216371_8308 [Streptomyces sp. TLI_053]|nr:hypothetical protein SAMN05216371_8308 [Streptomyces sp. TLI_053]